VLREYFKSCYQRAMREAYGLALREIIGAVRKDGACLDCGSSRGYKYDVLNEATKIGKDRYVGIEWNAALVESAIARGLNVIQGDLNKAIGFPDNTFGCVFGLSVLEHLLNPCRFLAECYRCLEVGGTLVILTPNISTYFTMALLMMGKMPSSGPHPDSDALLKKEEIFKVSDDGLEPDTQTVTPAHRHLVVFSYKVLKEYLGMVGFKQIQGRGFGLYPFPNFMQPVLERVDPYHCHQMVFVARK